MVNWLSPAEVEKDELAFEKLIYALFGLYAWELFQTSGVEWSLLVTRQRTFKWPMVLFYFLCRYCMLWALIGLIISFNVTTEALYTFNSWTGNMAILCASTSLMIRTIAIWERKLTVVIPLLLCLAHWGLLYHGIIIVRATWDAEQSACVVDQTDSAILKFTFFATMGFDLIIFAYTCTALLRNSSRSGLWHLLFRDGLIYWVVTFSVNAIPAILNSVNLNTTVPAATVAAIAACRCVVRLQDYRTQDMFLGSSGLACPSLGFSTGFGSGHSHSVGGSGGGGVGITSLDGRALARYTFGGSGIASYDFGKGGEGGTGTGRGGGRGGTGRGMKMGMGMGMGTKTKSSRTRPEVHIRTDQITMEELSVVDYEDRKGGDVDADADAYPCSALTLTSAMTADSTVKTPRDIGVGVDIDLDLEEGRRGVRRVEDDDKVGLDVDMGRERERERERERGRDRERDGVFGVAE
ncbi:hypothetical protein M0805_002889 [Coniferiporia weirii]|nr:hypothetical protein M0805_002889 [Coniferiporia weirii]